MKSILAAVVLFFSTPVFAEIIKKPIEYKDGKTILEGYLIYNSEGSDSRSGILIAHNWLGLTEETKAVAAQYAEMGYVVMAIDVYGKGVRPTGEAAGKEAGRYKSDRDLFRRRMNAAFKELNKLKIVDKKSIFAIGYCFGGTGVIELARSGASVNGVISVHGGLDSPDPSKGKSIKSKILALHGADDPFISEKDLKAFEEEMRSAKVDWQLIKYGNAVHSFTDKSAGNDNSKGAAYNAEADRRSWAAIQQFLNENGAKK